MWFCKDGRFYLQHWTLDSAAVLWSAIINISQAGDESWSGSFSNNQADTCPHPGQEPGVRYKKFCQLKLSLQIIISSLPDAALALLWRVTGGQEVAAEHGLVPGEPLALGALAAVLLAVGRVLGHQVAHEVVLRQRTGRRHELLAQVRARCCCLGWCRCCWLPCGCCCCLSGFWPVSAVNMIRIVANV